MKKPDNKENDLDGLKKANIIGEIVNDIQKEIPYYYTINMATNEKKKFAKALEEINKASEATSNLFPEATNN